MISIDTYPHNTFEKGGIKDFSKERDYLKRGDNYHLQTMFVKSVYI